MNIINTFKFYCHKILPLVYDESLSYYEVLCKVVAKLNEVINGNNELLEAWKLFEAKYETNLESTVRDVIEKMKEDGEFEEIFEKLLNAPQLVDRMSLTMYAQVFPFAVDTTNWSGSGSCVAVKNGVEYAINCFHTNDDSSQVVKISRLDSGEIISSATFSILGHANGCSYDEEKDLIYVACAPASGTDNLVALNWNLSVNEIHVLTNDRPYGVAVVGKYVYIACSGNRIKKFDKDFNEIEVVNFTGVEGAVGQGLGADENFFYMPVGNHSPIYDGTRIMFEGIAVYRHDGSFYKLIFCDTTIEVESIGFYHDGVIIFGASLRRTLLFKGVIYQSGKLFHTDTDRWVNRIQFSNNVEKLYVNETYVGYLSDGSEVHPIGDFRLIAGQCWLYANTIEVHCLSDITYPISIKNCEREIVIEGHNNEFAGIYLGNNTRVTLKNMSIISKSSTEDGLLCMVNCKEVECVNVDFAGTNASYSVYNVGCSALLRNCHVINSPATAVLYGSRGGIFRLLGFGQESSVTVGSVFYSGDNLFDATSLVPCVYSYNTHKVMQSDVFSMNGANHNGKSVFDFKLPGVYNIPASTVSLTDKPTSGGTYMVGLKVEPINNTHIKYTAYMTTDYNSFAEKVSYLRVSTGTHSDWA